MFYHADGYWHKDQVSFAEKFELEFSAAYSVGSKVNKVENSLKTSICYRCFKILGSRLSL